jgi:hypothetical protein
VTTKTADVDIIANDNKLKSQEAMAPELTLPQIRHIEGNVI